MMDQKVVDTALRDASRIVAEYLSGPREADKTIVKLIEVLDDQRFAAAVRRLKRG